MNDQTPLIMPPANVKATATILIEQEGRPPVCLRFDVSSYAVYIDFDGVDRAAMTEDELRSYGTDPRSHRTRVEGGRCTQVTLP